MFEFCGDIKYTCNNCGDNSEISIDEFSIECVGSDERQMGCENLWAIEYEFNCPECDHHISLKFEASEYPIEVLNFIINQSSGATTEGEPDIEYLREIYTAEDLFEFYESIPELITALKSSPYLLRELSPREFEEVVAEIFRSNGFHVDLTKRTRDGGKDIIAIHTDKLGIQTKYFVTDHRV